ncbi:MAG TPA: NAD(P)-dependent oxidoreductase [bacterium]|nr:NAD(P)-dependent oxidoreductase [bacterium]
MKIVVTGHKGYIGREVLFLLHMMGYKPAGIDLESGGDVANGLPKSDVVIHLATKWSGPGYIRYNTDITQIALKNTNKIVFASSSHVYGEVRLASEDFKLDPVTKYGKGKKLCEKLILRSGIAYSILRLSNVYSLHDTHGIVGQFLKGDRTIHGTGSKIRDFVRLEDIVPVIVEAAISERWNDIYNLSTGSGISTKELFNRILPGAEAEYVPSPEKELKRCVAANGKARMNGFITMSL